MSKQYYIKERKNPQLKNPYFTAEGQLTKAEVKIKETTSYGRNILRGYDTEEEYKWAIKALIESGYTVTYSYIKS